MFTAATVCRPADSSAVVPILSSQLHGAVAQIAAMTAAGERSEAPDGVRQFSRAHPRLSAADSWWRLSVWQVLAASRHCTICAYVAWVGGLKGFYT